MVPLLLCASSWQDQRRKGTCLQYLQTLIYIKAPQGILQSLSIPQGHHWLCPAMQRCLRLAQLLSYLEGLKSRSKAGSGLMKGKALWKQIRTGSQTVTNKIINGIPSLSVFPSFVSLVVSQFSLSLLGRGNQISKLIPCWLENRNYFHTWKYSYAKYSPAGFFYYSPFTFFFPCNEFLQRIIKFSFVILFKSLRSSL